MDLTDAIDRSIDIVIAVIIRYVLYIIIIIIIILLLQAKGLTPSSIDIN